MGDFRDWVCSKRPPLEFHGDRMYYFELGGEHGVKHDDGRIYYRLNCSYWFGDWIETQDPELWESYGSRHRAIYIVREELMTLIKLKWL